MRLPKVFLVLFSFFLGLSVPKVSFGAVIFTTEDPLIGTENQAFTIDRENISTTDISLHFGASLASIDFDTTTGRFVFSHDIDLNGNAIADSSGSFGTTGQVLTSTGNGQNLWQNTSLGGVFSMGLVQASGNVLNGVNANVNRTNVGRYTVSFAGGNASTANYIVQLTNVSSGGRDDYNTAYANRGVGGFDVIITEQDNGGSAGTYRDSEFSFTVFIP